MFNIFKPQICCSQHFKSFNLGIIDFNSFSDNSNYRLLSNQIAENFISKIFLLWIFIEGNFLKKGWTQSKMDWRVQTFLPLCRIEPNCGKAHENVITHTVSILIWSFCSLQEIVLYSICFNLNSAGVFSSFLKFPRKKECFEKKVENFSQIWKIY